jgi:hypothetical protein
MAISAQLGRSVERVQIEVVSVVPRFSQDYLRTLISSMKQKESLDCGMSILDLVCGMILSRWMNITSFESHDIYPVR